MIEFRTRHSSWYQVPVLYGWWDLTASGALLLAPGAAGNGHGDGQRRRRARARRERLISRCCSGAIVRPAPVELLPVVLGGLLVAAVDDRLARVVDRVGDLVSARQRDAGDEARERARDVIEGVVIVVADDHLPRAAEAAAGRAGARQLNRLAHNAQG